MQTLISVCRECVALLRTAGELVIDPEAKTKLLNRAEIWEDLIEQLEILVGGAEDADAAEFTATMGVLNRALLKIRSASGKDGDLLDECKKTEARLCNALEKRIAILTDEQIIASTTAFMNRIYSDIL